MTAFTPAALPLPPGDDGLPWIGETLDWVRDPLVFARERRERWGDVFRTRLLGRPCAVLLGVDANRFMLGTHRHLFSSRAGWGRSITSLIGNGLSLIDGDEHRRHRRMIQPALHGQMLYRYFDLMQALTVAHAERWRQQGTVRLFDGFKDLSFEIVARLMLGLDDDHAIERFAHAFHRFSAGLFALPAVRLPGTPYGHAAAAGTTLRRTLRDVLRARRAAPPADDILSLLIVATDEHGVPFTDAELIDELLVLLWAGHDTVTSMLTWIVYELLHDQPLLTRCRAEQDALAGGVELDTLKHMPLLDRVLREAERMHPPAPGGFRGVLEPFTYGGYTVPAGWTVMYSIVWTHHDPARWHNPLRFDPDRFAAPRNEGRTPFGLIGFGGGPRICVGLAFAQMQMRIVIAHLLRTLDLQLQPDQSFRPVAVPTKMPEDRLIVAVGRRS